jgi:predicted transglutaminase-like protease
MTYLYGGYTANDGHTYALQVNPALFSFMVFPAVPHGTPKLPQHLKTRKEVLVSTTGSKLKLPYPSTTPTHALGSTVTYDFRTWTVQALLDEVGTGVSS